MRRVIDIQDDQGRHLLNTFNTDTLPEFVKYAEWEDPATSKWLERDYALVLVDKDGSEHPKYACANPGNVVVSMTYLEQALPHLGAAAVKVASAVLTDLAYQWGLPVPPAIEKAASAPITRDVERCIVSGRKVRYEPAKVASVQAPESDPFTKVAAAKKDWATLSPQEKRATAIELVYAREQVPVKIPDFIEKYAGFELSPRFAFTMHQRATNYTSNPEIADAYETLGKVANACELDSLVNAVYELDGLAGLHSEGWSRYNKDLPDPVLAVYDSSFSKQAEYGWSDGGDFMNETELVEFMKRPGARRKVLSVFKSNIWDGLMSDPVGTFQLLPVEQKRVLSRMIRQV